jgi:hypothetical protein
MAAGLSRPDRRAGSRRAAAAYGFEYHGHLRPGTPVLIVNLSTCGALVESAMPCRPGVRTELHLDSPDGRRHSAIGEVLRCWVTSVAPLRFRSAVSFEAPADLFGSGDAG